MSTRISQFAAMLLLAVSAFATAAESVTVFKTPYCGCCEKWVRHLRQNGFAVETRNVSDVPAARQQLGMPAKYGSCHTAKIGSYVIEGHVPAADIRRLLREKPKATGLAVPSMPPGSPGMESDKPIPYQTFLVLADGSARTYARH